MQQILLKVDTTPRCRVCVKGARWNHPLHRLCDCGLMHAGCASGAADRYNRCTVCRARLQRWTVWERWAIVCFVLFCCALCVLTKQ